MTLLQKASTHGEHVGLYAKRLLEGKIPWTRMRHIYRLLGLVQRFGAKRVDDACQRALELDVVDVTRISRMLVLALERQRQAPPPRTKPSLLPTPLSSGLPVSSQCSTPPIFQNEGEDDGQG
jgi:hypothetical protein